MLVTFEGVEVFLSLNITNLTTYKRVSENFIKTHKICQGYNFNMTTIQKQYFLTIKRVKNC